MQLSVQPVAFFPVAPVKPVVRHTDAPSDETRPQPQRTVTQSHLGRNLDLKV